MTWKPDEIRRLFPAFVNGGAGVYLDNAATTQVPDCVRAAVAGFERGGRHDRRHRQSIHLYLPSRLLSFGR